MKERKQLESLFVPGDRVRFRTAPDIEGWVQSVTHDDSGSVDYRILWWHNGERREAFPVPEVELESAE